MLPHDENNDLPGCQLTQAMIENLLFLPGTSCIRPFKDNLPAAQTSAVYILSGSLTVDAMIHQLVFNFFGNICRRGYRDLPK